MKKIIAGLTVLVSMSAFSNTMLDDFKNGDKFELIQVESDEICSLLAPDIVVSKGNYQNSKGLSVLLLGTGSRVQLAVVPKYANSGKHVDRSYNEMYSESVERTYDIFANDNTASINVLYESKPDLSKRILGGIDGALGGSYSRTTSYDEDHQLDKTEDGFIHTVLNRSCSYKKVL